MGPLLASLITISSTSSLGKSKICLLLADRLRQQKMSNNTAVIIINTNTHYGDIRAGFGLLGDIRRAPFMFEVNHNLYIPGHPILLPVNSGPSFCFIWNCLAVCAQQHTDCKRATSILPSRVIDIGYNPTAKSFIFESNGTVAPYVALSHCWGGNILSRTEKGNLQERLQGIELSSLAQNFQDAIKITRDLGLRYIWIDALCIIQDDEEDWMKEAACMSDVYSKALFVISASDSPHSETGLFFQRYACVTRNYSLSSTGFDDLYITHKSQDNDFEENAPINKRCWALQERVAAVAVLHVGFEGLFWECRTQHQWQGQTPKRSHPILKSMSPRLSLIDYTSENQNLDLWSTIVALYTARQLTYRHDKYAAIAGLANLFEEQGLTKGRYLAGLWEGSIDAHLLWYARRRCTKRALDLAPSWSWASVDSPVGWFSKTLTDFEILPEESCTVDFRRTHVYQTAKTAHRMQGDVVLTGFVAFTRLVDLQQAVAAHLRFPWWTMHHPRLLDDEKGATPPTNGPDQSALSIFFDGPPSSEFYVIRLCSLRFLSGQLHVLTVPGSESDHTSSPNIISYYLLLELLPNMFPGTESSRLFRRVGIMQIPKDCLSLEMEFKETSVTIV